MEAVEAQKAQQAPALAPERRNLPGRAARPDAAPLVLDGPAAFAPADLMRLQRLAGNGSVNALLARGAPLAVQRQPPAGTDTSKLDALIARVAAECDAFGTYKKSPLDGSAMPGGSIQTAVSRWGGGPVEPWMKPYVREKMGPLRIKLLSEMASMSGVGWPDYETLFDISIQSPDHKYTLELKAAKTITEKAIAKIVPTVTVSYTNTFGWAWHRDYTLAAVEISAGVSVSKEKGKKTKPKGGLSGGPLSLDIKGTASAQPVPIRYCGGNDFTGVVTVVKTSAKGHVGPAGGALPGLTGIVFHGTPAGDVSFAFISSVTGSISGGKTDAGVDLSIGEGLGKAIGRGETVVEPPPELVEVNKLTKSFREWEAVVGPFETGHWDVLPGAAGILDTMRTTVYDFKRSTLDPQAQDLRDQSVDPEKNFRLDFEVVGMASRAWATAPSDPARLRLNEQLSARRAAAVETEIHNRFPDTRDVVKKGAGAHAVGPIPDEGGTAPMLTDAEAQAVYEEEKRKAMAEPDPEVRRMRLKAVEANFGPHSDQQAARRVYVFCRWEGSMIMKTLVPATSSPTP